MRRIGLFGGTFDPPHIGHFIMAQEVKNKLSLDEVWFIPTNEPPHKDKAASSARHRYNMLQKAIASVHSFHVNDIELTRKGKSYTIDTVQRLQKDYPNDVFYLIMGADMVEALPNWHNIDELSESISFVGVMRPNHTLNTTFPVQKVNTPLIEISSTIIREYIKKGWDVTYFLPHEVYKYMKEHLLYEPR